MPLCIHPMKGINAVEIPLLYTDPSLIVCVKPVGISSESPGLPDLIAEQCDCKALPVHRLDQGTGGKGCRPDNAAIKTFSRFFRAERLAKLRLAKRKAGKISEGVAGPCADAVISGCPDENEGVFTDLLWHDRQKNKSFIVDRRRAGVKEASCSWKLLNSTLYDGQKIALIRVMLHTGRTHQIRVQFGSRGFPLVGDRKYGSRLPAESVSLWASAISFPRPDQKSGSVSVTSLPPDMFPWNLFDLSAV